MQGGLNYKSSYPPSTALLNCEVTGMAVDHQTIMCIAGCNNTATINISTSLPSPEQMIDCDDVLGNHFISSMVQSKSCVCFILESQLKKNNNASGCIADVYNQSIRSDNFVLVITLPCINNTYNKYSSIGIFELGYNVKQYRTGYAYGMLQYFDDLRN